MKLYFTNANAHITQTAGIDRNGNLIPSYSHQANKAIDLYPVEYGNDGELLGKVYAPCNLECVVHKRWDIIAGGQTAYVSVFNSTLPVELADGSTSNVSIMCIHGGELIKTVKSNYLKVGDRFNQFEHFYTMNGENGTDANGNNNLFLGLHVHMAIQKGHYTNMGFAPNYGWLMLPNDEFIQDLFFANEQQVLDWNSGDDCVPFILKSATPFNPVGKSDGWYKYNGEDYYVENQTTIKGWKQLGNSWFYLNADDGHMMTGWLASGNDWYWLSPTSGVMQVSTFVDGNRFYVGADGKMVRSGWTLVGSDYYYFKDKNRDTDARYEKFQDGEKLTETWIPGSSWFYVKKSGIMSKAESILINGKAYNFDSNCSWLNP